MAKRTLVEELERLQEYDFMAGPGMIDRPDTSGARTINPAKFNPRSWRSVDNRETEWPYEDETGTGPDNATGRIGQRGVGRGGIGWGGREDVSGGIREPSAAYQSTWKPEEQDEGVDWDEQQRHGEPRNLWRDTDIGKKLKSDIGEDEIEEAMGTPYNFTQAYGHGNNMTAATNPGVQTGWARSPNLGDEEEDNMRLREFFDPAPIRVQEIDNPGQDNMKDQSDEDIEPEFAGRHVDDREADEPFELHGTADASGLAQLGQELAGAMEEPENTSSDFENIMMIPNIGHSTDHVMSPEKFGSVRGSFGLKADSKGPPSDIVDKSSAWDVLSKVVNALGEDEGSEEISAGIDDIS